ncbi:hypothetical protein M409DRAFT_17593 [Zasmidium cellare ATCC 36951]|uniref:Uncharacterized protein n=1 Tax=Zasmidium cellare ATCC 36951 TaxID=1080233 RepID=A0A6A6D1Q4_ZASCE|nr:uncharacterized protein M409DRAFT_17593 [Zasmidium cellare ATCC 36951]KAF2172358.1 hypothetical protein M409DRAFT_17593 [Zasmidium cellare ATCC 36951]
MNIRDFWGHLDPIALVCIIAFTAMLLLAIVLLTVTQRLAAREVVNAYNEHSQALTNRRYIFRQRRRIQTDEILMRPPSVPPGQSSFPTPSASRQSLLNLYAVPPRKPVPKRKSRDSLEVTNDYRSPTPSAPRPPRAQRYPIRQHPPLYFQRPGYQPVPIFDHDEELAECQPN